jgi:hypothetical protein
MKWILLYLRGIIDVGLLYDRGSSTRGSVENFVDSYFVGSLNMRGSLTGYVFTHLECIISWKAILKFIVALSTTENEFIALTKVLKETLWFKGLVDNLSLSYKLIVMHCDNQSIIHLIKN